MKYIYVLLVALLLQSCSTIETFSTWVQDNDESMVIVRIATSEAVYSGGEYGSEAVCSRADRAGEIISQARVVLNNTVLSLVSIDRELNQIINDANLNPTTSAILVEIALMVTAEHAKQVSIGAIAPDARVTLNSMLDAARDVVDRAGAGC